MVNVVEMRGVGVRYPSGVDGLIDVNLNIERGEFVFVVGSSGAGKSTLIKLMLKEIDATTGSVKVNGFDLNKLKNSKIHRLRRTIGTVFQDFRLIPTMNVYDNVAFTLRVTDKSHKYIRERVSYVLNLVRMSDRIHAMPNELSGGEQQRTALARALVSDPRLIIADEPTGNVDPELSYEIVDLLKSINGCGTTVVMVTHEHDLVQHFGGRIISIQSGEIQVDEYQRGSTKI